MLTKVIKSDTIDQAAQRIIRELKEDTAGTASSSIRRNVIYFDGWDGLGASAVLREVSRRLAAESEEPALAKRGVPAAGLDFSQIFHIDCSKWESRRAMQRVITVQLGLPAQVMDMLDARDKEDDYQGVGKGSRTEMPQVSAAIYQHRQSLNCRFLVVFHNGSSEEIDFDSFGFPLSGYLGNKVLWSFQGRFRLYPRTKVDRALKSTGKTDVFLSANHHLSDLPLLLAQEAAEVERELKIGGINWLAQDIENCFLYTMKLCSMGKGNCDLIDYDLATHGCNYWKCDGVAEELQHGNDDDRLLWLYDALQNEMRLDVDYYQNPYLQSPVARSLSERISYWTSPTYGFMMIPDQYGRIPKGMFQQFDKLCVLKLSTCKFNFTSPPFLCCHNLRFLWLDHCQDERGTDDGAGKEQDIHRCFQRLWVLDLRYSSGASALLSAKMMDFLTQLRELNVMGEEDELDMEPLHGRLHNIRKLRVTRSETRCNIDSGNLFSRMDKMELLDFSGNHAAHKDGLLSVGTSCSSLETIIIEGSSSLKKISLMGCTKLKDLLLSGTFKKLYRLDITGAVVKTLDLSAAATPLLDELNLLDCGKLCAILWPTSAEAKMKTYLGKLIIIDTSQKEGMVVADHTAGRPATEFDWHISIRDARLLRSLGPVKDYFGSHDAHVEISTISTPSRPCADAAGSRGEGIESSSKQLVQVNLRQHKGNALYADVATTIKDNGMQQQANENDCGSWATMWPCPPPPCILSQGCYIHIEDQRRATRLPTASIPLPGFICDSAKILHMHDSLFITNILASPLGSTTWSHLEWCQVEWCPKSEHVFSSHYRVGLEERTPDNINIIFENLKTIWASHLPKARFICEWEIDRGLFTARAFADLTLLHLYCCPRLVYSISVPPIMNTMRCLETLEIMWCGDLTVIVKGTVLSLLGNLKRIHLHELPMLQGLCDFEIPMIVPNLKTIKIRGCWSLKTLPLIQLGKYKNVAECDCEKEWWDRLEWESMAHFNSYKRNHSRYYKKTMLRGSVLR